MDRTKLVELLNLRHKQEAKSGQLALGKILCKQATEPGLYVAYPAAGALAGAALSGEHNKMRGAGIGAGTGLGAVAGHSIGQDLFGESTELVPTLGRFGTTAGGAVLGHELIRNLLGRPKPEDDQKSKHIALMDPGLRRYLETLPTPVGFDEAKLRNSIKEY